VDAGICVTTIDLAPADKVQSATRCGVLLQQGLATLEYPQVETDQGGAGPQDGKPYEVQMVLNPKAWGSFQSTRPITVQIPST
jgi:hypothetical protein